MAITYTQVSVNDLEVIENYKELMKASTGEDSVYLKAKETITSLLDDDVGLRGRERGEVIAQSIASIANNITNAAMQAAIELAKDQRNAPYELTKFKEDTRLVTAQIALTEKKIAEADKDAELKTFANWKSQAELYRDFGIDVGDLSALPTLYPDTSIIDYGLKRENIRLAQANVYSAYANGYRQNGVVQPTVDTDGMLTAAAYDTAGLTHAQTNVAIRQEQGFDDNMRQHVANSSASMISMLLSTEASGIDYTSYLANWTTAINYLNEVV